MAGSVNKVIIIGHLGRDPEVKQLQDGKKLCNLSIATSETWKDRNGERQERTEWHRVVIWNEALVEIAEKYLQKGRQVFIEGQLETRKWTDQSGQEKYSTEVVLRPFRGSITLLSGGGDSEQRSDGGDYRNRRNPRNSGGGGGGSSYDDLDQDIPF